MTPTTRSRYRRPLALLLALGILAALFVPLATVATRADQQTIALSAGKQIEITCETTLNGTVEGQRALLACADLPTPVPTSAPATFTLDVTGVTDGQQLSGTVNVEAKPSGSVARIVFTLEGPKPVIHTEKAAPYFFLGDKDGTPNGWDTTQYPNGDYTLKVLGQSKDGQSVEHVFRLTINNAASATAVPTATTVPATAVPATAVPATAVPATAVPATAVPATATTTGQEQPVAGQLCPAWVHDRYTTKGPDGKDYPTWHPPVDPEYKCYFGHEHGADPRTSKADSSMPAFGYAAGLAGFNEPHEGYKVFILNSGTSTDKGNAPADFRLIFHFGTSRTGRYATQFHSFEYDYVARDGSGREAHVTGMADTFDHIGSTCDNPRVNGRDFSTVGCNDPYEIWGWGFDIKHPNDPYQDVMHVRLHVGGAVAAFDPITTRDPSDNSKLVYTQDYRKPNSGVDPTSPQAAYQGCQREMYGGPNYWNNAGKSTSYWTDPYGNVKSGPGDGLIEQQVSTVQSTNNEQYKYRQDFCGNGIRFPN